MLYIARVVIVFFIFCLSMCLGTASASYFQECEGVVTVQSIAPEKNPDKLSGSNSILADIHVHKDTFNCVGHNDEIQVYGETNNIEIALAPTINKNLLKQATQLQVKYVYEDWMLPTGGGSSTSWTAANVIKTLIKEK